MESSELRRISYSQDSISFKSYDLILNYRNQKYVIDELVDINKIEEVSMKFQNHLR